MVSIVRESPAPADLRRPSNTPDRAGRGRARAWRAAVVVLLVWLAPCFARAQDDPQRRYAPPDPYTEGDEAALRKAGYVSLGPFPFGSGHDTTAVENLLGTEPLHWIETAHFRIGCALSPLRLKGGEEDWVAKTKGELKRLSKRLPKLKPDTKELDPWLRTHLIAQRLEDLYAEVMELLGVTDASFPEVPDDPASPETFRGLGPYLGMPQKFTVLLLLRNSSHARYTRAYQGNEMADPLRYHDIPFGCMYYGGAEETANGLFANDLALHTHLVFNVAHNLYSCYRSFSHELPAWLPAGLAHWHARRVSPRFPTYDRKDDRDRTLRSNFWEWDKRAPGLLANNAFEPLSAFLNRASIGEFTLEQHIESWALADFLMDAKKEAFMAFLRAMKDPFHQRLRTPSRREVEVRQHDLLVSIFGVDADGLEKQWRAYVLNQRGRK
ncbi:MAG TPA: hypothetical protein VFZ65_12060 [Planctomycetota bacterium]|nr:hypothetical protein [Planctomycetota bacterium]